MENNSAVRQKSVHAQQNDNINQVRPFLSLFIQRRWFIIIMEDEQGFLRKRVLLSARFSSRHTTHLARFNFEKVSLLLS